MHFKETVTRAGSHFGSSHFGSIHFCSNTALLARVVSLVVPFDHCIPRKTTHYASQGMDFLPNTFRLVRGDSRASPEGVATPSLETRLARSFRSVQTTSATEVAARQCSPTEPGRSEGSGTKSGRQVAERVGCIRRVSGSSGASGSSEGSRTCSKGTPSRGSSRGVSGVNHTLTETPCTVGGATSEGTA